MPFISLLHSALHLILHFTALLHPIYALASSLLLLCGWAVQVGFWAQCDLVANLENATPDTCYQSYIQINPNGGYLEGINIGLTNAKLAFGIIALIL